MSHVWGTIPEREVHQGACVVPQFCSVLCVEEDEEPAPLVEKFTTRIQLLYLHGVRLQLNIMPCCTQLYILQLRAVQLYIYPYSSLMSSVCTAYTCDDLVFCVSV